MCCMGGASCPSFEAVARATAPQDDVGVCSALLRLPILLGEFELRKIESGRHGAADQRPVAGALGGLPGVRRNDGLRLFAGSEIRAEPETPLPAVIGNPQCQRAAGIVMPDLDRID